MLVYQVTVAAYIFDMVTIIIATQHPLFFRNLESHQLKQKTIPRSELQATFLLAKSMKNIYESLIPVIPTKIVMLLELFNIQP